MAAGAPGPLTFRTEAMKIVRAMLNGSCDIALFGADDHVPSAGRAIPGRLVRKNLPAYPPRAMREAWAVAFGRRD